MNEDQQQKNTLSKVSCRSSLYAFVESFSLFNLTLLNLVAIDKSQKYALRNKRDQETPYGQRLRVKQVR